MARRTHKKIIILRACAHYSLPNIPSNLQVIRNFAVQLEHIANFTSAQASVLKHYKSINVCGSIISRYLIINFE